MVTTSAPEEVPTIGELLRRRRGDGKKVAAYSKLGVTATTYDSWENDHYLPDDAYVPALADYLGEDEREMAWLLYLNRKMRRGMGVYLSSPHTVVTAHAA